MEALNVTLQAARKAGNLTQQELGARLGWAQGRVSAIENGRLDPRLSGVVQMARVLDQELVLVPRDMLTAVQALISGTESEPLWNLRAKEEVAG